MTKLGKYISEFNQLFEELTGIKPENAKKGRDDFLFIPLESNLPEKDDQKRSRISYLSGYCGWRNHIVKDEYAGWWILSPQNNKTLTTKTGLRKFENYLASM